MRFPIVIGAILLVLVAAGAGFWQLTAPDPLGAGALPAHQADAEHGKWVFHAAGCGSCHADPKAEGDERYLLGGGVALTSAFGTFHAPNISPGPEGIEGWTDLDFVNAVLRGVSPDGAHYYPSFPYPSYQRMRVEDALDLKAFIDTLPPVATPSPEHELPALFRIRRGIGLWKRIFMDRAPFLPGEDASPEIRHGAYLSTALGHCTECHTPRDRLGGPIMDRYLAGGPSPEDPSKTVPNITPHSDGIGDWSIKDITDALRTGFLPGFETFGGSMVAVQKNMAELSDEDREAIAAYLKAVPPLPNRSKD